MEMSELLNKALQRNIKVDVLAKLSRDWICNAEIYLYKPGYWDEQDSYEVVSLSKQYNLKSPTKYTLRTNHTGQEIRNANSEEDIFLAFIMYEAFIS